MSTIAHPHCLTKLRRERKVSMLDLARAVDCSKTNISKIENRHHLPSPNLADRIARYFDGAVTRDQLLFPEDGKPVSGAQGMAPAGLSA